MTQFCDGSFGRGWSVGRGVENTWLRTCYCCGQGGNLHRCSNCPRSFHGSCLEDNEWQSVKKGVEEAKYLCRQCNCEEDLQQNPQVDDLIQQIIGRCKDFPSAHPVSILGETLKIIKLRNQQFSKGRSGEDECVEGEKNGSCQNSIRSGECKRMRLSQVENQASDANTSKTAEALMNLNMQAPQPPQVCARIQDVRPLPVGRGYIEAFTRDGVSTPPQCKLPKSSIHALRAYARYRFNQDVTAINTQQLQHKVKDGFQELRLNYYMRFDMDMEEIRKDGKFSEVVGNQAPWLKIVHQLIGQDCQLYEILCQIARPGAPPQSISSDEQCGRLFPSDEETLPPYAVKVFVPLMDLSAGGREGWNGAFEFVCGSHKGENNKQTQRVVSTLAQGQAALMDFRLKYRCLGNCSKNETLVISLVYVKRGFLAAVETDHNSKPKIPRILHTIPPPKQIPVYPVVGNENIQRQGVVANAVEIQVATKRPLLPKVKKQYNVISHNNNNENIIQQQILQQSQYGGLTARGIEARKLGQQFIIQQDDFQGQARIQNNGFVMPIVSRNCYVAKEAQTIPAENTKCRASEGSVSVAGRVLRATASRKATISHNQRLLEQQQ